jgi:hypothetical protein
MDIPQKANAQHRANQKEHGIGTQKERTTVWISWRFVPDGPGQACRSDKTKHCNHEQDDQEYDKISYQHIVFLLVWPVSSLVVCRTIRLMSRGNRDEAHSFVRI